MLHTKLPMLYVCCWMQSKLPQDYRHFAIINLYKNKWNKSDRSNYQRISLLWITRKILFKLRWTDWYLPSLNNTFPRPIEASGPIEVQQTWCFFSNSTKGSARFKTAGTSSIMFVDPTKVFDTANREGMRQIMEQVGCSYHDHQDNHEEGHKI